MPTFEPRKPIVTQEPVIVVDAGLPPGRYLFQLVAIDEAGNESQPNIKEVIVLPKQ